MVKRNVSNVLDPMGVGPIAVIKDLVKAKLKDMKVTASHQVIPNEKGGYFVEFSDDIILIDDELKQFEKEYGLKLKHINGTSTIILRDLPKDEILQDIQKNYLANRFPELNILTIPITFSYEEPPILKNREKMHEYPICNLLGIYYPKTKSITIFLLGILAVTKNEATNLSKYNLSKSSFYHMLLKMVILHEIGHFWFDKFIDESNYEVAVKLEMNKNYDCEYINEWIAQMFAYLCLNTQAEKDFMIEFANKQPGVYQSFRNNLNMSIADFKEVSDLLRLTQVYNYTCCNPNLYKEGIIGSINNIKQLVSRESGITDTANDLYNAIKYNL